MRATGLIRRFDDLGRIQIPNVVRKAINNGVANMELVNMEIFIGKDNSIILKKYEEDTTNKEKWYPATESPKQITDSCSLPVLVQYKDETADLEVLHYNFITKKFCYDQNDFTENVLMWRYLPDKYA